MNATDLAARLEGAVSAVEVGGVTISYRHPTNDQISAAMAKASVNPEIIQNASASGAASIEAMEETAKMRRAYEFLAGYCISSIAPSPELENGAKLRVRDKFGLRTLSDEALDAIDPYASKLGEYLLEQSNISDAEGEP